MSCQKPSKDQWSLLQELLEPSVLHELAQVRSVMLTEPENISSRC